MGGGKRGYAVVMRGKHAYAWLLIKVARYGAHYHCALLRICAAGKFIEQYKAYSVRSGGGLLNLVELHYLRAEA